MKSFFNKVWDSPYIERRGLRYKDSALRIIFDRNTESNKREEYSLGRFKLGSNNLIKSAQQPSFIPSERLSDDSYGVFSSGVEIDSSTENCAAANLICSDDSGTDLICPKGKCIIGTVIYEEDSELWKYQSVNEFKIAAKYDSEGVLLPPAPLIYYTQSKLKNNPSSYYSKDDLIVDKPATKSYKIINSLSLEQRNTLRINIAAAAYIKKCSYREACIESNLREIADTNIRLAILSHVYSLGEGWRDFISTQIEAYIYDSVAAETLLSTYLDTIDTYRDSILLEEPPRYSGSRLIGLEDEYAKPIYSRFPDNYKSFDDNILVLTDLKERFSLSTDIEFGTVVTTRAYNRAYKYLPREIRDPEEILSYGGDPLTTEPFYTPRDRESWIEYTEELDPNIEQWITSGADLILSDSKIISDQFYHKILDPNTCDPTALDWISQFLGFTGEVWDESWSDEIKRAVLLNAFGWYEQNLYDPDTGYRTLKGEICSKFPFNLSESNWVEEDDNFDFIKWNGEQPEVYLQQENQYTGEIYFENIVVPKLKINKEKWLGLHQTKGSLMNLIWWLNTFDVKDCNLEAEIINNEQTIIYIDSLRPTVFELDSNGSKIKSQRDLISKPITQINNNLNSSQIKNIAAPIVVSPAQCCNIEDVSSIENPLLAGISGLQEEINTVIPLSFKYSRFNPVWDQMSYVIRNWMPVYTNIKLQYQYMAADYVAADDIFFDPYTPEVDAIDNFDYLDWSEVL